jgi:hypothetical protein
VDVVAEGLVFGLVRRAFKQIRSRRFVPFNFELERWVVEIVVLASSHRASVLDHAAN